MTYTLVTLEHASVLRGASAVFGKNSVGFSGIRLASKQIPRRLDNPGERQLGRVYVRPWAPKVSRWPLPALKVTPATGRKTPHKEHCLTAVLQPPLLDQTPRSPFSNTFKHMPESFSQQRACLWADFLFDRWVNSRWRKTHFQYSHKIIVLFIASENWGFPVLPKTSVLTT